MSLNVKKVTQMHSQNMQPDCLLGTMCTASNMQRRTRDLLWWYIHEYERASNPGCRAVLQPGHTKSSACAQRGVVGARASAAQLHALPILYKAKHCVMIKKTHFAGRESTTRTHSLTRQHPVRWPHCVGAQPTFVHTLSCVLHVVGLHCPSEHAEHSPPLPPHCDQALRMMVGEAGQPLGAGGAGGVGARGEGDRGRGGDCGRGGEGGGGGGGVGPGGVGGPAVIQLMGQLLPPEHELLPVHMHWHVVA